jgi:hypothetical protein
MRALGSLIQCFDTMASSGFAGGGRQGLAFAIQSQRELQELCQLVSFVLKRLLLWPNGFCREYQRGKLHCTVNLLFYGFGLVCFANKNKNCHLSYS